MFGKGKHHWYPQFVLIAAQHKRTPLTIRKERLKPHLRTASTKIRALTQLEIIPERLRANVCDLAVTDTLVGKTVQKVVHIDAAGRKLGSRSDLQSRVHKPKEEQGKTL